jgi:hypothetical protein
MLQGMGNQVAVLAAAVALALAGCDKKRTETKEAPQPSAKDSSAAAPASQLGDLSTSLADVRAAFNAKKGEARFLTLLSPT